MKTASEYNELANRIIEQHLPKLAEHARVLANSSKALLGADEDTLADIGAKEAGRCRTAYAELIALTHELANALGQ